MNFAQFFSNVQESPWYREFLEPVVNEIPLGSNLLDVGTGPGKLLALAMESRDASVTGVDHDSEMLKEALKRRVDLENRLFLISQPEDMPFEYESFDVVTFCNLLFLLPDELKGRMITTSLRFLKKGGRILVLTPSGRGVLPGTLQRLSRKNLSMLPWALSTSRAGREWNRRNFFQAYAGKNRLGYSKSAVFGGLAVLEILTQ